MVVGIDLGTTFSAIATVNEEGNAEIITNRDGERTTPSVVMFEDGAIIVGEQAKENSIVEPYNVCQFVKRQMGTKSFRFDVSMKEHYSAEDISAMILKRLKEDAEDYCGEAVEGAVITVPAYFEDSQRKATQDAGEIAGLNVLGIINEPTAAAIAYCHGQSNVSGNIMVFDLGGGTFDITVMKMSDDLSEVKILATTGNRNLGGFDFDNVIINKVIKEYKDKYHVDLADDDVAFQDLRLKAESAKKALSSRPKANISVVSNGKPIRVTITREEFDSLMKGHLENMKASMEIAMDDANLRWRDLSKVLLVGGSTRIPCIQEMIEKTTGISPSKDLNPDEAVAIGASYYADILFSKASGKAASAKKTIDVVDVNSHSLGVITHDNGVPKASFIIEKNTPLPANELQVYGTVVDNQEAIRLTVVEGEDEDPDYDTIISETEIKLPPMPKGSAIGIDMNYDINGIVHIVVMTIVDEDLKLLGEVEIERKSNLAKEEVHKKRRNMDALIID